MENRKYHRSGNERIYDVIEEYIFTELNKRKKDLNKYGLQTT